MLVSLKLQDGNVIGVCLQKLSGLAFETCLGGLAGEVRNSDGLPFPDFILKIRLDNLARLFLDQPDQAT